MDVHRDVLAFLLNGILPSQGSELFKDLFAIMSDEIDHKLLPWLFHYLFHHRVTQTGEWFDVQSWQGKQQCLHKGSSLHLGFPLFNCIGGGN
jgi:hypothetical protein